jgi:hypothetical protein
MQLLAELFLFYGGDDLCFLRVTQDLPNKTNVAT